MSTQQLHYPNHYLLLSWFPNHALPAWLGTAVIMNEALRRRHTGTLLFIASVLPMWSVFAAMGVFPLLVAGTVAAVWEDPTHIGWRHALRKFATVPNLVLGPVFVLVFASMLLTNDEGVEQRFLGGELAAAWPMLLLFYLIEFGVLAMLLPSSIRSRRAEGAWWGTAIAILILVPFFSQGVVNDFCGRVFMPAAFVIFVFAARFVFAPAGKNTRKQLVVLVLVAGAVPGLHVLWTNQRGAPSSLQPAAEESALSYHEYTVQYPAHGVQGMGGRDGFFWRFLAKPMHVLVEEPGEIERRIVFRSGEEHSQWIVEGQAFTGNRQLVGEFASQVVTLERSSVGLRPDLLRRVDVVGKLEREVEGNLVRLNDFGVIKLVIRSADGRPVFGPVPLSGQGTTDAPWTIPVEEGSLSRREELSVALEIELLREGVHQLQIDSIAFWEAGSKLVLRKPPD